MTAPGRARIPRPRLPGLLAAALVTLGALLLAGPAWAEGESAAWWQLSSSSTPTNLKPGQEGTIVVSATNLGDATVQASATHKVTITDKLPPGVTLTGKRPILCSVNGPEKPICGKEWPGFKPVVPYPPCTTSETEPSCTFEEPLAPYERWELQLNVKVSESIPSGSKSEINKVTVSGGEAAGAPLGDKSLERALIISDEPTQFGVEDWEVKPEDEHGAGETQAGKHPFQFTTTISMNRKYELFPNGKELPSVPNLVKDLRVDLPAGLIGNANKEVIHQCTELQFSTVLENQRANQCPEDTAVGVAIASITEPVLGVEVTYPAPLFNLVPSQGEPARFGFIVLGVPVTLDTVVRGGDYHVVVNANNVSEEPALLSTSVTIWGVPGDPRHDQSRGSQCIAQGGDRVTGETCELLNESNPLPFLTLPTSCSEALLSTVSVKSWTLNASFTEPLIAPSAALTGCSALPFEPRMTVQPAEHSANTPTGLKVVLTVPQPSTLDRNALAESEIRDSTVTLPAGVQLSPSAADGLASCSLAQIGFTGANPRTGTDEFNSNPPACPENSKVGTVAIKSPDIEPVLHGSVYIAAENENPFGSLFGIYIVVEDPVTGVLVKLAGKVTLDEQSGQVTTTFPNAPQQPFEELALELFNGPRASLATPRACGAYSGTTSFSPWSGTPPVNASLDPHEFEITSGPDGTGCANPQPFGPLFQAGTTDAQAGAFTSFSLSITRPDTDQQLSSTAVTLPPGLAGIVKNVERCPEEEANAGTCGPGSLIGSASAVSGLGPDPFTVTGGRVYLTGPYKGAPFGLSIVLPAKAGPFDFGIVVTRATITVDPYTTAITITSGVPTMLNTTSYHTGVPVQLRRIDVTVDRPQFEFNPSNCSRLAITGVLGGDQGASAPVSAPFQASGCEALPFKPQLTAETDANYTKVNGTSLVVKVTSTPGQANIAKTRIAFPLQLPSRLTTIQKACRDTTFEANPASCPEGSLIGTAIAHTPVFANPLSGPAYLVSHGNAAFPDAEFVLQGEGVTLILDGQTDIKNGITTSTFNSVPDDPVSTFEVLLPKGPHSAFTGYGDLCHATKTVTQRVRVPKRVHGRVVRRHHRIVYVTKTVRRTVSEKLTLPTTLTGQNGDVVQKTTPLGISGCKKVAAFKAKKPKPKKKKSKRKKK